MQFGQFSAWYPRDKCVRQGQERREGQLPEERDA